MAKDYSIKVNYSDNHSDSIALSVPEAAGTYKVNFTRSDGATFTANGNVVVGDTEKTYNLKFGLSDGSTINVGNFKTITPPSYVFYVSGGSRGYSVYVDVTAGANGASVTFGGVTKNVPANTTQTVSYTTPSSGQVTVIGSTAVCPGEVTYTEDNKSKTERWTGITQVIRYDTTWTKVPDSFVAHQSLTSIPQYVPGYLSSIGTDAFSYTNGVGELQLEEGITSIGERAFTGSDITNRMTAWLPSTLEHIDSVAFSDCLNVTSIIIPELVKTLGSNAFGLDSVKLPLNIRRSLVLNNVETVGAWAFGCNIFSTILNTNKIKTIEDYAFSKCVFPSSSIRFELPTTLTSIGQRAFNDCYSGGQYSETPPYLLEFEYAGTTSQWNAITKGEKWGDVAADAFDIICTNGVVTIK